MSEPRLARSSEIDQIVPLVLAALREEHGDLPFDQAGIADLIRRMIDIESRAGACLVVREKDVIVGSVGLLLTTEWYEAVPHLRMAWLYVTPEHRRSPHSKHLSTVARRYADELHLSLHMPAPYCSAMAMRTLMLSKQFEDPFPRRVLVYEPQRQSA